MPRLRTKISLFEIKTRSEFASLPNSIKINNNRVTIKEESIARGKRLKISKILSDQWSIIVIIKFTPNLYINEINDILSQKILKL